MKQKILFLIFFVQYFAFAQPAQTFVFEYDTAGNQVQRYIYYSGKPARPTDDQATPPMVYDEFKYYPNPVKDELFLEWKNQENKSIEKIEMFDLQGKFIWSKTTSNENSTTINLQSYAKGMYLMQVFYSDNTIKTIKIVKD